MILKKKMFNFVLLVGFFSFLFLLLTQGFLSNDLSWAANIDPKDKGCYDRGGVCTTLTHERDYGPCNVGWGVSGYIRPNLCNSSPDQNYRCCIPIDESKNSSCTSDLGGKCQWFPHTSPTGSCVVDGKEGQIQAGYCDGAFSDNYRCCVPLKETLKDEVVSDQACENIGGECQKTNSVGGCSLSSGGQGCYVFGACRTKPQDFSENDLYLCCVDVEKEGWCVEGVKYELWRDVYLNGDCPFSKPSESDDKLWCSQGPDTGPSHNKDYVNESTRPSVDIKLSRSGEPGTEYFIAPADGFITKAQAYYENKNVKVGDRFQRCGCHMIFETKDATYEIRHCFLFGGVSKDFDSHGNLPAGHPGIKVHKGEVIAKIALESDHRIIDIVKDNPNSCASGEHFHVKVEGAEVDRCVDCFFVDKLGCNLYHDTPSECGRCWRRDGPPECFSYDWGALCDEGIAGCNTNPIHYCCKTDRVWIDDPLYKWVCKCPHPSPKGVGIDGKSSAD